MTAPPETAPPSRRLFHPAPLPGAPEHAPAAAEPPPPETHALTEEAQRHVRVLRLGPGDRVVLFDGEGQEVSAELVPDPGAWDGSRASSPRRLQARPLGPVRPAGNLGGPRLVLVQGLPRGGKLDGIVRMCTELGVRGIQLARSERTQGAGRAVRLDRLTRVAREATRQSGAPVVPRIEGPGPLLEVADRAPQGALRLLAWEGLADPPGSGQGAAGEPPPSPGPGTMDAWVVVGPEGGFSEGEVDALRRRGYRPIGLGSTILRVETAAPVALALVAERLREGRIGPR